MDDLAAWLTEIWDEDEVMAKAASPGPWRRRAHLGGEVIAAGGWDVGGSDIADSDIKHIARHDPGAVLARIAADRQILALHGGAHDCQEIRTGTYPGDWPEAASWGTPGGEWRHAVGEHFEDEPCPTVRLLALPHADRPGYQEAWRP